jgi:hypothetical protein
VRSRGVGIKNHEGEAYLFEDIRCVGGEIDLSNFICMIACLRESEIESVF